jgi:hypothetical protein
MTPAEAIIGIVNETRQHCIMKTLVKMKIKSLTKSSMIFLKFTISYYLLKNGVRAIPNLKNLKNLKNAKKTRIDSDAHLGLIPKFSSYSESD